MAFGGWKGAVRFGPFVQFSVKAMSADRELRFLFNQHHAIDGGRIRAAPGLCEVCGEEVTKDDIVRGYKGAWGIDEEYLDSLALEKSSLMELDGLVPAEQIEPRWYKRSYDVVPEPGSEKPYVLFLRLMEQSHKVAIGKLVAGGQEHIVTLRPRDGVVAMELMWWPEELRPNTAAKDSIAGIEVSEKELAMGQQLVTFLARDFDPSEYRNEYKAAIGAYLDAFVAGAQPPVIQHVAHEVVSQSLEDALAASIAAMAPASDQRPAKKGRKGRAA